MNKLKLNYNNMSSFSQHDIDVANEKSNIDTSDHEHLLGELDDDDRLNNFNENTDEEFTCGAMDRF